MGADELLQQLVNALSLGALYAMLALGLAIVFGVMKLLNFAYGELITVCAYSVYVVVSSGRSFWLGAVVGVIAATLVSVITERLAFRPLRDAPFITVLFSSFAVAVIIQNLIRQLVSPRPRGFATPGIVDDLIPIGGVQIGVLPLATIVTAVTLMVAILALLQRTKVGLAMRAAAQDFENARLMGISANRVILFAFALSGFVAGVAGVLWVARTGAATPDMGFTPVLKAFVANVIGGLGNLRGAVLGGMVLGLVEVSLFVFLPGDVVPFVDAFALLAVVVVLYFRPQGLIGRMAEVRT